MATTPFSLPVIDNEPFRHYAPGSKDRVIIDEAIASMKAQMPFDVPVVIGGKEFRSGKIHAQVRPDDVHGKPLCNWHEVSPSDLQDAITRSAAAQKQWFQTPWHDRARIYLRAAQLCTGKYRDELVAATMLGQGKNVWQSEVDAIAELVDFFRFSVKIVNQGYAHQPISTDSSINTIEYRPIEGFTLAVPPFNFTAIGGNLVTVPTILGGVVLFKPSPLAMYSNYLVHKILLEAGLPPDVIQFVPGDAETVVNAAIEHPDFAALHFTGSSTVLRSLWAKIGANIHKYKSLPRIIGESAGKNFHLIHLSADRRATIIHSIRSAFQYQGQKCSALSRLYIPRGSVQDGWLDEFVKETKTIKQGPVDEYPNFMGPVINEGAFDRITDAVKRAVDEGAEILTGGNGDKSKGFFYPPTILHTKDPKSYTMRKELFGPVVTVYVYDDTEFDDVCKLIDTTTDYALTGAIFSNDRAALNRASELLKYAAGNVYLNEQTTGAIVGQHPFGGGRSSGTNDKSGTWAHFSRFVSPRTIKDKFVDGDLEYLLPSNMA